MPFTHLLKGIDRKVFKKILLVGSLALLVKIIGFAKELCIAHRFGTSDEVDAYLVAFAIPVLVAYVVGEAIADAVIPAYTRKELRDHSAARRLISQAFLISLGLLTLCSLIAWFLSGEIAAVIGHQFETAKQQLSAEMLRLLLPFAVFFGTAPILAGYLQVNDRFLVSSAAPGLVPMGTILLLLFLPDIRDGRLLSIGASAGALVYLALLVLECQRKPETRLLASTLSAPPSRELLLMALPLMGGALIHSGCYFTDTLMAASLEPGSVAVLDYGEKICSIIKTVGALALGRVMLPHLSKLAAKGQWHTLKESVRAYTRLILILSGAAILVLWFAATPAVRLLLERGAFTGEDTARVSDVLQFAAFQIPGYLLFEVAACMVIALQGSRYMMVVAAIGLGVNVALNYLFMHWFEVKGIALSTAITALLSAILCYIWSYRKIARDGER